MYDTNCKQAHMENVLLQTVLWLSAQSLLNVTTGLTDGYNKLVRSRWILDVIGVRYCNGIGGVTSVIKNDVNNFMRTKILLLFLHFACKRRQDGHYCPQGKFLKEVTFWNQN
jgi:hypothetical protein